MDENAKKKRLEELRGKNLESMKHGHNVIVHKEDGTVEVTRYSPESEVFSRKNYKCNKECHHCVIKTICYKRVDGG